jgi:3'-phosphoadenosine 5'-phosphosulfate sulfotransferase (PAPS reductase)/FAD synthetase
MYGNKLIRTVKTVNRSGVLNELKCKNIQTVQLVPSLTNNKQKNNIEIRREFHSSITNNSLLVGGIGVVVLSIGIQQLLKLYSARSNDSNIKSTETVGTGTTAEKEEIKVSTAQNENKKTNSTNSGGEYFSGSWFARNFYDGGFEEKITKREAALILGVRESASVERIKEAHRRILLLNHPDRGGSAYIAAKVNEAKDLLMRGKQ